MLFFVGLASVTAGLAAVIVFWNKIAPLLANISSFFGNIWNWIQNLVTSFVQFLEIHSADISMGILLVILVAFSTYLMKDFQSSLRIYVELHSIVHLESSPLIVVILQIGKRNQKDKFHN